LNSGFLHLVRSHEAAALLLVAAATAGITLPLYNATVIQACLLFGLDPVSGVLLSWLPPTLLLLGAGRSLGRQLVATRRLRRLLAAGSPFGTGADTLVLEAPSPLAFTWGFLRPRTAISRGMLELLPPRELAAVLAHEAWHRRRRDPLRLLLMRTLAGAFWFLPTSRPLLTGYELALELAADEAALRDAGRDPLAGAILHSARLANAGAADFAGGALEPRLAAALGEGYHPPGLWPAVFRDGSVLAASLLTLLSSCR
jgi:hypothetical protein